VFQGAFAAAVVDRATDAFHEMLSAQRAAGVTSGDHFAKPGANDRVWGALDKLALTRPEVFVDYYANDVLALASSAWLGPGYQVTSALNIVNPGGQAQVPHRDYHLGFMPLDTAAGYPAHVHRLSPVLTLQGAVAHCDMPVETGPTMYLPHSQKYLPGYLAAGLPDFVRYFAEHHVQLPLGKGDAVFFNPALFHGAGTNRSADVRRMANLLQVNSAFGRTLEAVDRTRATAAVYPVLAARRAAGASERDLRNVVAACAEGYPFPTNLDRDQPVDSLNPPTQAELVLRALDEGWSVASLADELAAMDRRHQAG
jgi:ectoine hydroxylase-related dioxygenase (phytanoyl-CoA dioxygenase family)